MRRANQRLLRKLKQAGAIIAFHKKVYELLGIPLSRSERRGTTDDRRRDLAPGVGAAPACGALGSAGLRFYRSRRPQRTQGRIALRPRAPLLTARAAERPASGWLSSIRTASWIRPSTRSMPLFWTKALSLLGQHHVPHPGAEGEVRERRDQAAPSHLHRKPELLATPPNEVWSWDITKLNGPVKWTYYYLYVILDIFSRYVVGWMVAQQESATLAQRLIADAVSRRIVPGPTDPPRRSGLLDEVQARRPVAGGSRGHQDPQPPARLQRQSVLGKPVQDHEVSPGLSRSVRLSGGCRSLLPNVLSLVQHRISPPGHRLIDAGDRALRPRRNRHGSSAGSPAYLAIRLYIRTQVILSIQTNMALPDSQAVE